MHQEVMVVAQSWSYKYIYGIEDFRSKNVMLTVIYPFMVTVVHILLFCNRQFNMVCWYVICNVIIICHLIIFQLKNCQNVSICPTREQYRSYHGVYLLNTHRVGLTWNRPLVPLRSRTAGRTDRDCVLLVYLCHNEMLLLVTGMLLYNV